MNSVKQLDQMGTLEARWGHGDRQGSGEAGLQNPHIAWGNEAPAGHAAQGFGSPSRPRTSAAPWEVCEL